MEACSEDFLSISQGDKACWTTGSQAVFTALECLLETLPCNLAHLVCIKDARF